MAKLFPKILFFISGTAPTPEQIAEADDYGPGVAFRNALLIRPDGPIEQSDGVAGDVPDNYKEALPHVSDRNAVIARMNARNPNLNEMAGQTPAVPAVETPEMAQARIDNALSRGLRRAPVNERNADAVVPSQRTSQSGDPRITHVDTPANTGWNTNPETINDAGSAQGETIGDGGQPGAVPVGAQGEGGPGVQKAPDDLPQGGAGNARAKPPKAPVQPPPGTPGT
jgi:hypothetical protein